jgi:uncharacterized repeat protein (TIGR03803 family)
MTKTQNLQLRVLTACILMMVLSTAMLSAQNFAVIRSLGAVAGDPLIPVNQGIIAQGRDGNLYSTTRRGGSANQGAIFKITPAGVLTVLHNVSTETVRSFQPFSGLVLGTDGNFYGSATGGGSAGAGTTFKMSPAGVFTALHNFGGAGNAGHPHGAPVLGTDGSLYGTATDGGTPGLCTFGNGGCGAIYKMSTTGANFKQLFLFDVTHGAIPATELVQGTDGNFYGATDSGGAINWGEAFKITPAGKITVLHSFPANSFTRPSGLIQANDGNFYGVAGGGLNNTGVVFKLTPAGVFTVLHDFCRLASCTDGRDPVGGLIQASDGNFYGTTYRGGLHNFGTIFRISGAGVYKVLYNFDNTTGATPISELVQHTNGIIYGDTELGGGTNTGVFFKLDAGLKPYVRLVATSGKVGATIQVLGQGFSGATNVSLNGTALVFTAVSNTFLTTKVPVGGTTGFLTVTTASGTLTSNKKYRVTPQLTSFTPASGPLGTSVKITGVSFTQATAVTFNGIKALSFSVDSDTQVTATVPVGTKTGKVAVVTAGGTAASATNFTVSPAITSFTPTSGKVGDQITLKGTSFTGATGVKFGSVTATFTVETDSQAVANVPVGAVTGKISITTPGGTGTSATNFTVTP